MNVRKDTDGTWGVNETSEQLVSGVCLITKV